MANPLQSSGISPVAPAPNMGQDSQQPSGAPQQNKITQMPAPDHAQTVAALRHFHAIGQELETLLKNPSLGRADIKSDFIDGVTKLVAGRFITPAQAVMQLADVPADAIAQRKWVMQHYQQNEQAANSVLDHHRISHAGKKDMPAGNPDNHGQDMTSLMQAHYGGR